MAPCAAVQTQAGQHTLVTGGRGFVGQALVDALVQRGDKVTVVDIGPTLDRDDIEYVEGDIRDEALLQRLCEGKTSVFHNASIVHTKQSRVETIWDINYKGSQNVMAACEQQRVPKLVYVSTASAVYEGNDIENGDETLPYSRISQAPYSDSKIAAEKLILERNGHSGVATCAIRPHVIFGPGDTRFLPAVLNRARAGKLKYAVGREPKLSDFTYVTNLTDALIAADNALTLESPVAGQAYFVTNGEPTRFWDFVAMLLEEFGLPPIRGTVPYGLAYSVAAIAEFFDTLKGGTLNNENGMTRFAIRYMCTHHYFSVDKARRDFGYEPKVSIREGVRLTAQAARAAGAN